MGFHFKIFFKKMQHPTSFQGSSTLQVPHKSIMTSEDETEDSVSSMQSHSDADVNPSDTIILSTTPENEPLSPIKPPPIPPSADDQIYPRRRASTSAYRKHKRRKRRDPSMKAYRASTLHSYFRQTDDYSSPPSSSFHVTDFEIGSEDKSDVRVDTDSEDLSDLRSDGTNSIEIRHRKNKGALRQAWSSLRNLDDVDSFEDMHDFQGEYAYRSRTVARLQNQLTDLNIELNKKNEYATYLEAQNSALREEIRETNEASRQLTASIEFLVEDNERIDCENKSLLQTVQELRNKEMVKLLEKIKVLEKENEDLKDNKYDTADYINELFNLRCENKQQRVEMGELSQQVVVLTQQNSMYEERVKKMRQMLDDRQSLPGNMLPDMQDIIFERDNLQLSLHDSRMQVTQLEMNLSSSSEVVIGRPVIEEKQDPMQIAWKKLGKSIVETKDLQSKLSSTKQNEEKMRVQLAELRSENKCLNRDLDKTRRMSAVLFEQFSQLEHVVSSDEEDSVGSDDDSDEVFD